MRADRHAATAVAAALFQLHNNGMGANRSQLHRSSLYRFAAAILLSAVALFAQSTRTQDLGIGKVLVARRGAPDGAFAKTVILLARYDNAGTLGLVLNRPTKISIASALDKLRAAQKHPEPIYSGGPVDQSAVFGLLRSKAMPDGASYVTDKVYLIAARTSLEQTLAKSIGSADFHLYAGYSGWSKLQLENEVNAGYWVIFPGKAEYVYDAQPTTLWSRLIARAEQPVAKALSPRELLARAFALNLVLQ